MTKSFNSMNLNPSIISALEKQNITVPTEIQLKVIPQALQNKDLIVQSETGTGKTLAYLLPLFEKLNAQVREMQAIILVPTHELAIQIQRQIERLAQNSELKVSATPVIGNVNIARQVEKLKEKPHIIVGSAGRVLELIKKKKISAHTIKTIILDEADRLVDENNLDNVMAIIKSTLKERQLMMFSATISQKAIARAKEAMKDPEIIRGEEKIQVPAAIEHFYFLAEQRDKIEVLRKLVRILNPNKAIVFVNKSDEIDVLTLKLKHHGLKVEAIHGSSIKLDRKKVIDEFRSGKIQLLVASDIAARGLDIEGTTHIFNLSMPEDSMDYLHRVGRTGRAGNAGTALSIVTKRELPLIRMYENNLKIKIAPKDTYKGNIIDVRKVSR
ncbi:MAG: DEAD/DEAH box helicase [Bacillota bacterium]